MSILSIQSVSKRYPSAKEFAVNDLTLTLNDQTLLALVGDSGSGKTTLLRMIAGLEVPDRGSIHIKDQLICDDHLFIPPEKRGIALVFQEYALFPHLTVSQNIGYGLQKLAKTEKHKRVQEMLSLTRLKGYGARYPFELSGGEQQRVALARSIAPNPALLLLDEPFSNLDEALKASVRTEIHDILKSSGISAILVTHDTRDALAIADEIAVIRSGNLEQVAPPNVVYNCPANEYVARFFGKTNLIPVEVINHQVHTPFGILPQGSSVFRHGQKLMLRPDALEVLLDKPSSKPSAEGIIISTSFQGSFTEVALKTAEGTLFLANYLSSKTLKPGATAFAILRKTDSYCFV